jgi:hypothetical protein
MAPTTPPGAQSTGTANNADNENAASVQPPAPLPPSSSSSSSVNDHLAQVSQARRPATPSRDPSGGHPPRLPQPCLARARPTQLIADRPVPCRRLRSRPSETLQGMMPFSRSVSAPQSPSQIPRFGSRSKTCPGAGKPPPHGKTRQTRLVACPKDILVPSPRWGDDDKKTHPSLHLPHRFQRQCHTIVSDREGLAFPLAPGRMGQQNRCAQASEPKGVPAASTAPGP